MQTCDVTQAWINTFDDPPEFSLFSNVPMNENPDLPEHVSASCSLWLHPVSCSGKLPGSALSRTKKKDLWGNFPLSECTVRLMISSFSLLKRNKLCGVLTVSQTQEFTCLQFLSDVKKTEGVQTQPEGEDALPSTDTTRFITNDSRGFWMELLKNKT